MTGEDDVCAAYTKPLRLATLVIRWLSVAMLHIANVPFEKPSPELTLCSGCGLKGSKSRESWSLSRNFITQPTGFAWRSSTVLLANLVANWNFHFTKWLVNGALCFYVNAVDFLNLNFMFIPITLHLFSYPFVFVFILPQKLLHSVNTYRALTTYLTVSGTGDSEMKDQVCELRPHFSACVLPVTSCFRDSQIC